VYAFYRYVKRPSPVKIAITGLAAGLALAAKHSGILVFPILVVLALMEVARSSEADTTSVQSTTESRPRRALRLVM
jgi:predicted membrane-bound dolichyl-phosphate-mannose-protein mannosyltransferase